MLQRVVLHPADEERGSRVSVLLLHHLTQVVQIVLVVDSEPDFVVLIRAVLLVLQQVSFHVLVLRVWNRQRHHQEGVKGDGNTFAKCAFES